MRIRIGHSNDPDDAFMVWALAEQRIDTRDFEFDLVPADIQTLNEWALEARLEVTALSVAAYPQVRDRYAILPHGASLGIGYGPIIVSRAPIPIARLRETELVIPGRMTTAFLVARLALGDFRFRELPFDRILDEVRSGQADAGLLIHEGQLTYGAAGLVKSLDLGEWWEQETGLPLPLGVNAVRRDAERITELSEVLRESIEAALAHRDEALAYALAFARDLNVTDADRFVELYVNEYTRDLRSEGRRAVEELLRRASDDPVKVDFVATLTS